MPQGIICFILCQDSKANMLMIYLVSCVSVYYSDPPQVMVLKNAVNYGCGRGRPVMGE